MSPARRGAPPERRFALPDLTPFDGDRLGPGRDYDAVEVADRDLSGQDASAARLLECRIARCRVDGLVLRRSRILGSLFEEIHGTSVDWADSTWRDSRVSGGRLGALILAGASCSGSQVIGSKLDFVNLAGATLDEVVFEHCEIAALDARGATLTGVTFVDCSIHELNITETRLSRVDLSGARLRTLVGVDSLRGATISHDQLMDLAPLLAAQLGIKVRPPEPSQPD